jgi:hypothetical protein
VCPELYKLVQTGDTIEIDLDEQVIIVGDKVFSIPAFSPSVEAILQSGGLVPMLRQRFAPEGTSL